MTDAMSRWESPAPIRYPDPDIWHWILAFIAWCSATRRSNGSPPDFGSPRGRFGSVTGGSAVQRHSHRPDILRWDETTGGISIFREPSHYANGNTRDRQGRLITCEHDTQRADPHRI